jgi:hypothetical protein
MPSVMFAVPVGRWRLFGLALMVGCTGPGGTGSADSTTNEPAGPRYAINGNPVELDVAGPDGTVYLHSTARGDLNRDGREDQVVVLTVDGAGSGRFYHLNAFLDDGAGGWVLIGEDVLGDRIRLDFIDIYADGSISPVTGVAIHPDDFGQAVAAFYTHSREQSFSDDPSIYITRHWRVEDGRLLAVDAY